jgi:hypothetical protein
LATAKILQVLHELVRNMLSCDKTLPESNTAMIVIWMMRWLRFGSESLKKAKIMVVICHHRTLLWVEHKLQEMDEFKDKFE